MCRGKLERQRLLGLYKLVLQGTEGSVCGRGLDYSGSE